MKSIFLASTCLLYAGTVVQPAFAQESSQSLPSTDAAQPEEVAEVGLSEIVITAQRRSENLQKAGIAVTAVGADDLIKAGVTDPTGLTNLVPALTVATAAGPYALYYLRGVGNFNGNALSDSAVAVNLDGVFLARPSGTSGLYYDIERVEVLKGPQGTLYGRNATGGAVNIITRRPRLGELGGEFSASYGNYEALQLNGALNVPLGQNAAMRVAGQYVRHDGYMSDLTNDQDDLSGRIQLLWEPTATVKVQLGLDYFKQGGRGAGATVLTDANPDRQIGLGDPRSTPAFAAVYFFPSGNTYKAIANDPFLDNRFWGTYGSVEVDAGFATWTTIAAYRSAKLNFRSNTPSFLINQQEEDEQFSIESRLAANTSGPFQWMAGAYYFDESISVPNVSFNQQVAGSYQNFFPKTKSLAFFGRLTASLSPTFRLTAGGRYTTEDKSFKGQIYSLTLLCGGTALRLSPSDPVVNCFGAPLLPNTLIPGPIFAPNGTLIPFQPFGAGAAFPGGPAATPSFLSASVFALDRSEKFDRFTWRAGFEWDVLDRSLLYGSFETGFKSGGFFFTRDNPVFRPETINAWTLGMKNRFLDNRLQLNVEAFWWTYRDQQVSSTARDSAGNVIFATRNVGKSTNRGFEIEAVALATPTTRITANLQYLDAVYDSFVYSTPNNSPQIPSLITSVPPNANCPFTLGNPTTVYVQDCSGKRPPNAPEWVFSIGGEQTIPLGAWKVVVSADTRYQTKIFTGLEYLAPQLQAAYWQSNASITFAPTDDRFFVTGFINNIEDNNILGGAFPNPFGGANLVVGTVRPPRTYGIRAGLKF
jgi:iron complex outermembrane receptor protein